jgi:choline-sulfatase
VFRGLTERDKQGILASYFTCVEYLDKNVGLVLDALDRSGRAGNTLVVFLSDHGLFLGEHAGSKSTRCTSPPCGRLC